MYPVLFARHDEQNLGRRQRKYSRMQVWATQFNGENNTNNNNNNNKRIKTNQEQYKTK